MTMGQSLTLYLMIVSIKWRGEENWAPIKENGEVKIPNGSFIRDYKTA